MIGIDYARLADINCPHVKRQSTVLEVGTTPYSPSYMKIPGSCLNILLNMREDSKFVNGSHTAAS
jgi:hypothetical protein